MIEDEKTIEILVIDELEEDYDQLRVLLDEIHNFKFNTVRISGYEPAMEAVREKNFDLYFINFVMSTNTGLDLLRNVVSHLKGPVIFLTGKSDREADLQAMQYGASDYFVKSEMHSENLERSIRYALESYSSVRALKESEDRYRSIFERSLDMIYITDRTGHFMTVNESGTRIFGYSNEEFKNLHARDLFRSASDHLSYMNAIIRDGIVSNFEVELKDKHGRIRHCIISGSREQAGLASDVFYHGIIHDISRRRKSERALLVSEKISVTGRIVRTLAHEVRNPLTNIKLAAEQLEVEVSDTDSKDLVAIIKRNGIRINDLIAQLLQASRPIEVDAALISVNRLLDDVLNHTADRINLKKIKVIRDCKSESLKVFVDVPKIRMAILNIIINAIEAMPDTGGILTFKCMLSDDGRCAIHIIDNGRGISKDDIWHLFEPYFSSKPNGVGLGLSTAITIIQSHGGTIDVESEVGVGTDFVILLKNSSEQLEPAL